MCVEYIKSVFLKPHLARSLVDDGVSFSLVEVSISGSVDSIYLLLFSSPLWWVFASWFGRLLLGRLG